MKKTPKSRILLQNCRNFQYNTDGPICLKTKRYKVHSSFYSTYLVCTTLAMAWSQILRSFHGPLIPSQHCPTLKWSSNQQLCDVSWELSQANLDRRRQRGQDGIRLENPKEILKYTVHQYPIENRYLSKSNCCFHWHYFSISCFAVFVVCYTFNIKIGIFRLGIY